MYLFPGVFSDVLDQHDDSHFESLTPAELLDCRDRFRKCQGDDPVEAHRPSNDQLSALAAKLALGVAPFADFQCSQPTGSGLSVSSWHSSGWEGSSPLSDSRDPPLTKNGGPAGASTGQL